MESIIEIPIEFNKYRDTEFNEIVSRKIDSKISAITKCTCDILKNEDIVNELLAKTINSNTSIADGVINYVSSKISIENLHELISKCVSNSIGGDDKKSILDITHSLVEKIDSIAEKINDVATISWLNVGFSVLNLGVTTAGFAIMSQKLDDISEQINGLRDLVQQNQDLYKEFNIFNKADDIKMTANSIFTQINDGRFVSHEKVENLIKETKLYISSIIRTRDILGIEASYSILYRILPIYAQMICLYYENYYDEYSAGLNPNHKEWLKVFEMASSKDVYNECRDFYFINKECHNHVVNMISDTKFLLDENMKLQIEDTLNLLSITKDDNNYNNVVDFIERVAVQRVREMKNDIKGSNEDVDINEVLEQAIMCFIKDRNID